MKNFFTNIFAFLVSLNLTVLAYFSLSTGNEYIKNLSYTLGIVFLLLNTFVLVAVLVFGTEKILEKSRQLKRDNSVVINALYTLCLIFNIATCLLYIAQGWQVMGAISLIVYLLLGSYNHQSRAKHKANLKADKL